MENFCFKFLIVGFLILSLSDVSETLEEQFAIEGASYKMKCTDIENQNEESAMSSAVSTQTIVIWSVNGTLPRGAKYKLLTDGLVIRNVSKEDALANYTCTVLDRLSFMPLQSANIKLKLRQKSGKFLESTSFKESSVESDEKKVRVWGILNQWAKLQCNMFSRPSPIFEWRKVENEEPLVNSSNVYKIVEDESTSNLTIFLHNETFFGEYICKALNNHGESIQHFILAEGYKPKSPFIYPTYIGKDRITVKVEPQEVFRTDKPYKVALPVTNFIIQYIEAEGGKGRFQAKNKKWTTIVNAMSEEGKSPYIPGHGLATFELRNLKGNQTYLVRCAVANAAAISDFSPSIRVTTEAKLMQSSIMMMAPNVLEDTPTNATRHREEYGRSSNLATNKNSDCPTPRYMKTITRTTISTTMIENLDDENGIIRNSINDNSSLVKKRVEEDTSVERMFLCSI